MQTMTLTNAVAGPVEIPMLGYGVYKVPPDEVAGHVAEALRVGYRLIDTAALYGNEEGVGRAIADSGLAREEVFVTTKLWNDRQGRASAVEAFEASLERLGTTYVDLYLIHWPQPERGLFVQTWEALQPLLADGRVRALGVSNFEPAHLDRLIAETGVTPALNQVELHPYLAQHAVREADARHGIATQAWGPIGRGGDLLADPVVRRVADEVGATPAQVVLAWHRRNGVLAIPKSVTPTRIRENFESLQVDLSADGMAALDGLDRGGRTGPDPNTFND